jgi:hypothetical protein
LQGTALVHASDLLAARSRRAISDSRIAKQNIPLGLSFIGTRIIGVSRSSKLAPANYQANNDKEHKSFFHNLSQHNMPPFSFD